MTDSDSSPHAQHPATRGCRDQLATAHVARLMELARHQPATREWDRTDFRMDTVGICGGGVMGTGIAAANLLHGLRVRLYDASPEALDRAQATLSAEFVRQAAGAESAASLLQLCRAPEQLAGCDLLIETVAENRELKQRVFRQLAPHLAAETLLATNTSTIRLSELSAAVPDPARFCGLHFCNPVPMRPLVEIVPRIRPMSRRLRRRSRM